MSGEDFKELWYFIFLLYLKVKQHYLSVLYYRHVDLYLRPSAVSLTKTVDFSHDKVQQMKQQSVVPDSSFLKLQIPMKVVWLM